MEWTKVEVLTTKFGAEIICGLALNLGINGLEIEDNEEMENYLKETSIYWDYFDESLLNRNKKEVKVIVYLSKNAYGKEIFLSFKDEIEKLRNMRDKFDFCIGSLKINTEENLDDKKWLDKWKEFFKPFEVGNKIIIKPEWEDLTNSNNKVIFNINPGNVFGTGLHQTTRLCIEQIEKYVKTGDYTLDIGCGSGILSIITLLLGAKKSFALDIDKNAVKIAYENAKLNNILKENYYVCSGNIILDKTLQDSIENKKYNLVVANIVADVICDITSIVYKKIKDDGIFIASGIIKDRNEDVCNCLKNSGFEILDIDFKDEWCCIVSTIKS